MEGLQEAGGGSEDELLSRALEMIRQAHSERAVVLLEAAARHPEASGRPFFLLAAEHAQRGRVDEALRLFEQAAARSPELMLIRLQWGLLLLCLDRRQNALAVLSPLDELAENDPVGCFARGLREMLAGAVQEASAWLEQGIRLNTTQPDLNRDMALLAEKLRCFPPSGDASPAEEHDPIQHVLLGVYGRSTTLH